MSDKKLNVVLYWHMHQPDYRNLRTGEYFLPWTYLHAIKDYVDMAVHMENSPQARAVVNFVPTLLEQIDDYTQQIQDYLHHAKPIRDPLLDALVSPTQNPHPERRRELVKACLKANQERLINRFKPYAKLAEMANWMETREHSMMYIDDQFLADICMWFHLAWLAETVRRTDLRVKRLMDKGHGYNLHERKELLTIIGELSASVIPRYKALAERGQVELSMTPYAHPIMPLLFDLKSTHQAMPDAPLPAADHYPGGVERLHWHMQKGLEIFESYFGMRPKGVWPSEGSVCDRTVDIIGEYGFNWLASGETVLQNSLAKMGEQHNPECIHRSFKKNNQGPHLFFRDDGLSDLIGFTYSDWHADDAVANLLEHLESIADACHHTDEGVVSIILDGENAWEYYPENGFYFLSTVYQALAENPRLNLTTYSEYLATQPNNQNVHTLVAGSWVYGTFSTWIGDKDKNRAWDILIEAKKTYDQVLAQKSFDAEHLARLEEQLAICEGSDWFWWFGDYNPSGSVKDFDYLYRLHLANLYFLLDVDPPDYLTESISEGGGDPAAGGVMRHGKEH